MEGYWHSPDLTFFSGATVTNGWEPTLERYRRKYQGQGKEMGALTFSDLQIDILGPEAAFVRGKWQLKMSDGKMPGACSLLSSGSVTACGALSMTTPPARSPHWQPQYLA